MAERSVLEATGVDIDAAQVEAARRAARNREGAVFLQADATQLPFDTGWFDMVVSNNATHHIPNWTGALQEMARFLKPGGYLLYGDLTVPAAMVRC